MAFICASAPQLFLHTTQRVDAGFDGDVYVTLENYWAKSEEAKVETDKLTTASEEAGAAEGTAAATAAASTAAASASHKFAPGSVREFTIKANDMSYVTNVTLRIVSDGLAGLLYTSIR